MSRSYRKVGIWKDHDRAGSAKSWKRIANHKVRRNAKKYLLDLGGRSDYKKATRMTWDIHAYKWTTTEREGRRYYREAMAENNPYREHTWAAKFETEDDYINHYWKKSRRK